MPAHTEPHPGHSLSTGALSLTPTTQTHSLTHTVPGFTHQAQKGEGEREGECAPHTHTHTPRRQIK